MGVDFAICSVRKGLPKVQKGRGGGGNGFLVLGGTSTAGSGVLIRKGGGGKSRHCLLRTFRLFFFPAPEEMTRNIPCACSVGENAREAQKLNMPGGIKQHTIVGDAKR